jgi:hypothetical protein
MRHITRIWPGFPCAPGSTFRLKSSHPANPAGTLATPCRNRSHLTRSLDRVPRGRSWRSPKIKNSYRHCQKELSPRQRRGPANSIALNLRLYAMPSGQRQAISAGVRHGLGDLPDEHACPSLKSRNYRGAPAVRLVRSAYQEHCRACPGGLRH